MRILAVVLGAALLATPAFAQQREGTAQVHRRSDNDKENQDLIQLERACHAQMRGLASRDGDVLKLTLENGKAKTFTDESRACRQHDAGNCLQYRLAAYYPIPKLFVIDWLAYESSRVLVVTRRTGASATLDVRPHLSPSGKRLVAAAAIEAWDVDNEIVIYSVQNGSLVLEWSYKAQEYEMWDYISWDGDDRIKLKVTLWSVDGGGNHALVKQSAELQRTNSGWVLNKNVPSGQD
jgi:hypothetical protein